MKPRHRIGIAGIGHAAQVRHIEAFSRNARAEMVVAMDPDPSAREAARLLRVPHVVDGLDDLFAIDFDVLSVCVPPAHHVDLVRAALNAGRHVLVEKPMAPTAAEARELGALAVERGKSLCVVHNFLFGRAMQRVHTLSSAGKLGQVLGATAVHWSSWNRVLPTWAHTLPGGLFFDEAPHLLYLIRHFLGDLHVEHAWSDDRAAADGRPNLRVEVALSSERGVATMSTWLGASQSEWFLAVAYTEATVVIDLFRDVAVVLPPERQRDLRHIVEVPIRSTLQAWRTMSAWMGRRALGRRHLYGNDVLVERFLDAIDGGGPVPVSASDGAAVVDLLEQIVDRAGLAVPSVVPGSGRS